MTQETPSDQYVFDHTISEQREDHLTNQLIAFNQAHSTALPIEHVDPSPLQVSLLDRTNRIGSWRTDRKNAYDSPVA